MSISEIDFIDKQRSAAGFLSIDETIALGDNNTIFDPRSTLISRWVKMGIWNILYPNTTIVLWQESELSIGDNNVFHSSTYLEASNWWKLTIGSHNHFEWWVTLKANMSTAIIDVWNNWRYINQILQVLWKTSLWDGSQVIGAITVQNCILDAGEDFRNQDPNKRWWLLKWYWVARSLQIPLWKWLEGFGRFDPESIFLQSQNHPSKKL